MAQLDQTPKSEAAFTLLELMIVVSIVSLLSVIMLPSLASARRRALSTKCITNQREIWEAVNRYEIDFNTTLVTIKNDGVTIRDTLVNSGYVNTKDAFECPQSQIKDYDDITLIYNVLDFQNTHCTMFAADHLLQ